MLWSELDIPVYTNIRCTCIFKFNSTLPVHLELRSIRLAPLTGLNSTLVAFNHVGMPPLFNRLN